MPSGLHHGIERRLVESPGLWAWNGNREYAFGESANVKINDWAPLKIRASFKSERSADPPFENRKGWGTTVSEKEKAKGGANRIHFLAHLIIIT